MKRTVHFDPARTQFPPGVGARAIVWPLDHDDRENVSNTTHVLTSTVVAVHEDGSFETENSRYVPRKD